MSGVAIGGAAIIGAGASIYSGNQQAKAADRATDSQAQAAASQLEFNKAQYADWQETYGPVQDNLSSYYNNLTPEHQTTLGIQNIQGQYQKALQQTEKNLAQRGLDTSGIMADTELQYGMQAAKDKAVVATNAPAQVAEQQSRFLGLGLGNQSALQGNISNSYGNMANLYGQQAATANAASSQAYGSLGNVVGSTAGIYAQTQTVSGYTPAVSSSVASLPSLGIPTLGYTPLV